MQKHFRIRTTFGALALAGLWLAWAQAQPAQLTLEKVTANLYVITATNSGCTCWPENRPGRWMVPPASL